MFIASASSNNTRFSICLAASSSVFGGEALQKAHFCSLSNFTTPWQHPLQIIFPQHELYLFPLLIDGTGREKMGQFPLDGGCLNSSSSYISAARLSHFFSCFDRCFFLHAGLKYLTNLHLLHVWGRCHCPFPHSWHMLTSYHHYYWLCPFHFQVVYYRGQS